jgi:hypothetical protein
MKMPGWVHQQSQCATNGLHFCQVRGGVGDRVQVGSGYGCGCQTNLLGIVAGQNGAVLLKMVCQFTIKVEAIGHPFVMAALVLQCFGSGKVHCHGTIITTVGASGVTRCVRSEWGCLGSGWMAIVGVARDGSMGSDLVVEFHA